MEDLVPIIGIICAVGLPIGFGMYLGLVSLKLQHKENMSMIEQGIMPEKRKKADPNRFVSLRNGIVLVSLGIGIAVGVLLAKKLYLADGFEAFCTIVASIVTFLGCGYLIYFFVTKKMLPQGFDETYIRKEE